MKATVPGYEYELDKLDCPGKETVMFTRKEFDDEGNCTTHVCGTTNEEVIDMLIDRLRFLNSKMHSEQNVLAIGNLKSAKAHLLARTNDRIQRGVEGTNKE